MKKLEDGTPYLGAELDLPAATLREAALTFAEELGGAVLLLGPDGKKVRFVVAIAKSRTDQLDAGQVMKRIAPAVNGRGGGKRHLAQGGGDNPAGVPDALAQFPGALEGN